MKKMILVSGSMADFEAIKNQRKEQVMERFEDMCDAIVYASQNRNYIKEFVIGSSVSEFERTHTKGLFQKLFPEITLTVLKA